MTAGDPRLPSPDWPSSAADLFAEVPVALAVTTA